MLSNKGISKGAAKKLASIVGRKSGVQVVFGGTGACTNFKSVFVPDGDCTDEHYRKLLFGYIIHEPGHIRHSVQGNYLKARELHGSLGHHVHNIFDDVFMERKQCLAFPGAHEILHDTVRELMKTDLFGEPDPASTSPAVSIMNYCLYKGRLVGIHQTALTDLAAKAEVIARRNCGDVLIDKLDVLINQLDDSKLTADQTLDLALAACDLIKEAKQDAKDRNEQAQQEQQKQQDEQESSDESDSGESGSSDPSDEGDSDDSPTGDDEGGSDSSTEADEKSETEEAGQDDESETDETSSGESDGDAESSDPESDDASDSSDGSDSSQVSDDGEASDGQPDASQASDDDISDDADDIDSKSNSPASGCSQEQLDNLENFDITDGEFDGDISDALKEMLSEETHEQRRHGHEPQSLQSLTMSEQQEQDSSASVLAKSGLKLADKYQGVLAAKLTAHLNAKLDEQSFLNSTKGRLSMRHLDNLVLNSGHCLMHHQESVLPDTAIQFVLDVSSSMTHVFAEALGFTYAFQRAAESIDGVDTALLSYGGRTIYCVNPFTAPAGSNMDRYINLPFGGGTPTGDALCVAAENLMMSEKTRKIVVLITDGQSNQVDRINEATNFAKHNGIALLGVGFGAGGMSGIGQINGIQGVAANNPTEIADGLSKLLIDSII